MISVKLSFSDNIAIPPSFNIHGNIRKKRNSFVEITISAQSNPCSIENFQNQMPIKIFLNSLAINLKSAVDSTSLKPLFFGTFKEDKKKITEEQRKACLFEYVLWWKFSFSMRKNWHQNYISCYGNRNKFLCNVIIRYAEKF